jgi:imidazole glycerol-phosphate synthase subunit HisH
MKNIAIIDYGAGNTKSLMFALQRLGYSRVELTSDATSVQSADYVIFPGVGHASYAMEQLRKTGLDTIIPDLKQPFLGICLGMQLMCSHSEEGDTPGLGIFSAQVLKFKGEQKVPHMGWNNVDFSSYDIENHYNNSWFYFVHSYYADVIPQTVGVTDYILPFSAVLQRDNFLGCQFHPEKSGEMGERFLTNFLK